jgi:hypothetical protein
VETATDKREKRAPATPRTTVAEIVASSRAQEKEVAAALLAAGIEVSFKADNSFATYVTVPTSDAPAARKVLEPLARAKTKLRVVR